MLEFRGAGADVEIVHPPGAEQRLQRRRSLQQDVRVRHRDRRRDGQPAELIQLELRVAHRDGRLACPAVQRESTRLDEPRFQHRRHARRIALHEHAEQFLKAARHFLSGFRALLRSHHPITERAHPDGQRGAELIQAQLGQRDLPPCDRLAQTDAPRKLEGLRQRHRPNRAVAELVATEVAHALVSEDAAQLRVCPFARRHAPSFRRGDLGFVKFQRESIRPEWV